RLKARGFEYVLPRRAGIIARSLSRGRLEEMEIRLDGRSALITGGSTGLGLAMAKEFALSGADVAIVGRRPEVLEEARQEISAVAADARVHTVAADVATAEGTDLAFRSTVAAF